MRTSNYAVYTRGSGTETHTHTRSRRPDLIRAIISRPIHSLNLYYRIKGGRSGDRHMCIVCVCVHGVLCAGGRRRPFCHPNTYMPRADVYIRTTIYVRIYYIPHAASAAYSISGCRVAGYAPAQLSLPHVHSHSQRTCLHFMRAHVGASLCRVYASERE